MQKPTARRAEAWTAVERTLNSRLQEAEAKAAAHFRLRLPSRCSSSLCLSSLYLMIILHLLFCDVGHSFKIHALSHSPILTRKVFSSRKWSGGRNSASPNPRKPGHPPNVSPSTAASRYR